MLVPLYGFVEGDTLGVLVLASHDMPIRDVAARLRDSVALRVDTSGEWELYAASRALAADATVESAHLSALVRVDLRRKRSG